MTGIRPGTGLSVVRRFSKGGYQGEPIRPWGAWPSSSSLPLRRGAGATAKLVWLVKLVAEFGSGVVSETEVGWIERDDFTVPETTA